MGKKIVIASGTRADWGLLSPLAQELQKRGVALEVWSTNMHSNPEFGRSIEEIRSDGFEPVEVGRYCHSAWSTIAENAESFGRKLSEEKPRAIIILGDRIEMLGVASGALVAGVPIVHIAGGTISEGAVDNAIRNAITQMAELHLTETRETGKRLERMGIEAGRIAVCGALGVYNATKRKLMTRRELEESLGMEIGKELLVCTLHAATKPEKGEEPLEAMQSMLKALGKWVEEEAGNRIILTWPNNDIDPAPQIAAMEAFAATHSGQVKVVRSLGALRYLSAVALSKGVVGNSSSGIVEVASLGVPTLDIGSRQKGRECGPSVMHCAPDSESIYSGLKKILGSDVQQTAARKENPYAQEETPKIMADFILGYFTSIEK